MLISSFERHAENHPDSPALIVGGQEFSYAGLWDRSACLAAVIRAATGGANTPCALFAGRTSAGFSAVMGIWRAGGYYVPFARGTLTDGMRAVARELSFPVVLADAAGLPAALDCLGTCEQPALLILLEQDQLPDGLSPDARHKVVGAMELAGAGPDQRPAERPADCLAYLLFTSGSTGPQKGVPVTDANLTAYISNFLETYPLERSDRCSQFFELTFDLSVHDMAVTWSAGACLVVPDGGRILLAGDLARRQKMTVWFSVPSLLALLDRSRQLKADSFPTLRLVFFCGEALPEALAAGMAAAAPRAQLVNLYGPTEATIAFTHHSLPRGLDGNSGEILPLGRPFGGQVAMVLNDDGLECAAGEIGELCLAGDQVVDGYWGDPEAEAGSFLSCDVENSGPLRLYRTGDLASWNGEGDLLFHGRGDDLVKLRGHRVELCAVETMLSNLASGKRAAVLPWPLDRWGNPAGLVACLEGWHGDAGEILASCEGRLPAYMIPADLFTVEALPMNRNGKLDRKALLAHYLDRGSDPA